MRVRLNQSVTHAGQKYGAGSVLDVDESVGQWLLRNRAAEAGDGLEPVAIAATANPPRAAAASVRRTCCGWQQR